VLAVQSSVEVRDLGAATSAASFFRSIGGSVGVSVFATLFNAALSDHLRELLPPSAQHAGTSASSFHGSPAELAKLPPAIHDAYTHSFVLSLQGVFHVAVIFAAVGFLISFALPALPLRTASGNETAAEAGGLSAVGQQFGLVPTGVAAVHEEIDARRRAAQAARERIDELEATAELTSPTAAELRRLYDARIAGLIEGAGRLQTDAERVDPEEWEAARELLRIQRTTLAEPLPMPDDATPVERARAERDRRVASLQTALDRVDGMPGASDDRGRALRALIAERVALLRAVDAESLGVPAAGDRLEIWDAVRDVLATERRALRDLAPELSRDTAARLDRDDAGEVAALAIREG
jgi:hypothetical protein